MWNQTNGKWLKINKVFETWLFFNQSSWNVKILQSGDAATWPIVRFFKCPQRNEFRQTDAFFESLHKRALKKYLYR